MTRTAIIPRGRSLPPTAVGMLPLGAGGNATRCRPCMDAATWDGEEAVESDEWIILKLSDWLCDCECHVAGEPCGGAK